MMEEHLRDNVERLLQDRVEQPSAEFRTRMESLLRPEPRAMKDRRMVVLAATAAAAALVLIVWIARQGSGPSPAPAAQGQSVVKGTVTLQGTAPKGRKIRLDAYTNQYPGGLEVFPVEVD